MAQTTTTSGSSLEQDVPWGWRADCCSAGIVRLTRWVPISPPVPRDGEQRAALLEAGNPGAGALFTAGCGSYAVAFRNGARTARAAQAAVSSALQGEAGPGSQAPWGISRAGPT